MYARVIKCRPRIHGPLNAKGEMAGILGNDRSIEGAGGGAADHAKRARRAGRKHPGDSGKHAGLVGGASTATGQDQANGRASSGLGGEIEEHDWVSPKLAHSASALIIAVGKPPRCQTRHAQAPSL